VTQNWSESDDFKPTYLLIAMNFSN